MTSSGGSLTNNMRATSGLLVVSVIAEVFGIIGTPPDTQLLAAMILIPAIILNSLFLVYGRHRKIWGCAGAIAVGIVLLLIQVAVSFQGDRGPPSGIEALYIILPSLVTLKSYESILELRI